MDWKGTLADLRAHLPPAREGGRERRGSLRWLEAEMRARGANPASVRNIVYRDVGTPADKAALRALLGDLAREAGRPLAGEAAGVSPAPLPDELELLGRSKKRAYKQFLAGVRAGRVSRLIVTGRAGAGKTILLDHVERALPGVEVRRLNLRGDASVMLDLSGAGSSFAERAQVQADAARAAFPAAPGVLLARVTADLNFAGGPPRLPGGTPTTPAAWAAEHLLRRAPPGVAVLLALEDPSGLPDGVAEVIKLRPPTPAEARAYLMARLGVTRERADALVRETGRHLDRLALLAGGGPEGATPDRLLADPDVRRLAVALAALEGGTAGVSGAILEVALGLPLTGLPPHARALLRGEASGWTPVPALVVALPHVPAREREEALRRLTDTPPAPGLAPARLAALTALGEWDALAAWLARHPDDARHLPPLWPRIRARARGGTREVLARAVAAHHAGRGEYDDPRARDALFTLLESPEPAVRGWVRVKLAESSVDAGNFGAATAQLAHPELNASLEGRPGLWTTAARADALLVRAALARWRGDLEAATHAASDPRTTHGGPRAHLWRGLIAKDAGRWPEALRHLHLVPAASPLLSARALYQEGDLRLRLGQPGSALAALNGAAERLEAAGAGAEERAHALARAATALRRLGRPREGVASLRAALALLPDGEDRGGWGDAVLRARLLSEGVPIRLALGQPDAALEDAARALDPLARPGSRRAEAEYRTRRTRYRVALAYLTRGLGRPYLQPFAGAVRDHPDLIHARALLDAFLTRPPAPSDREQVLAFDLHLSRALAKPDPGVALNYVTRALDMTDHPYAEALARAGYAEALLRAGQDEAALAQINRAHALVRRVQAGLPGTADADPGLGAQLLALETRATIADGPATLRWLREALTDPALAPFRPGVWRGAGQALEERHPHPEAVLRSLHPGWEAGTLRVRDALALLEAQGENGH
ncbi:hypothetical protein [Deinococcus apachensis]|uniref:hypothetical protein n=1 Tax=Deinococcus apachensis TaxID=309886 RepID=UPI00037075FA|nr:hypothetical protein [Deinococcus apachensis]